MGDFPDCVNPASLHNRAVQMHASTGKSFWETKSPKLIRISWNQERLPDPVRIMNVFESKNVVSAGAHRRNLAEYVVHRMELRSLFDYTAPVLISRRVSNSRPCAAVRRAPAESLRREFHSRQFAAGLHSSSRVSMDPGSASSAHSDF